MYAGTGGGGGGGVGCTYTDVGSGWQCLQNSRLTGFWSEKITVHMCFKVMQISGWGLMIF